jgi:hypothetical protein
VLPRNEASAALRELPGHILSPISRR